MDIKKIITLIMRERGNADYAAIHRAIDTMLDAEKQSVYDPAQELANQLRKLKEAE